MVSGFLNSAKQTVTGLDPRSGLPRAGPFGGIGAPIDLAVGGGSLWVSAGSTESQETFSPIPRLAAIHRIDPQSGAVIESVPLPPPQNGVFVSEGGGMAFTPGAVWVVLSDGGIAHVDVAARRVVKVIDGLNALALVGATDGVWVLDYNSVLHRIDPLTDKVVASIPVNTPEGISAIAAGGGAIWAASFGDGIIWRVASSKPYRQDPIKARPQLSRLAYVGGRLWGVSDRDGVAIRVDPGTKGVRTIRLGGTPSGLVAGGGTIWVPTPGGGPIAASPSSSGRVPTENCGPVVYHGRAAQPTFLIVSEQPLFGSLRDAGLPMADAVQDVLARRDFQAGPYAVGFQSCNDATPDGNVDSAVCARNAKAYAQAPRVIGVVGPYDSGCAQRMLTFLADAPGGPVPLVSPASGWDALGFAGYSNFARVLATDNSEVAATIPLARRLGAHRIFIVSDLGTANGTAAILAVAAARAGIAVAGTGDWQDQRLARTVAASRADGLIFAIYGAASKREGTIIRRMRRLVGDQAPAIAIEAFPISALREAVGPLADGMYAMSDTPPEQLLSPRGQAWLRQFVATTHATGLGVAVAPQAAQATEVLLDAIARSDGHRASVTRAVKSTEVRGTGILAGDWRFSGGGDMAPAPVFVARIGSDSRHRLESAWQGTTVARQIVPGPSANGFATSDDGTAVSLTMSTVADDPRTYTLDCATEAAAARCIAPGTFRATGAAARLICPMGSYIDANWFPNGPASRDRTLLCADGSTLKLLLRFTGYMDAPSPSTAHITLTWVITGGTQRFAHWHGEGVLSETFRFPSLERSVTGHLTGDVRTR